MASGAIKGITIEIGGDSTKLGKAIEDSEKHSRSLQVELRQVEKLLKFDPSNIELLSQKQTILTQNVAETSKKLDTLKEAEKQVIAQFERGEIAEEQVRALQREIIQTEKVLGDMKSELKSTEEVLKDVSKGTDHAVKYTKEYQEAVENAKEELSNFKDKASEAFDTIATGATAIGGAMVAVGGYALNLSIDFDKAFNTLATQTGATAEEMESLNASMENIYANNFGEDIEDVAKAMAVVKTNTKLTGEELESVTQNALLMRDTFDFEVNESIRAVNSLMNQFGITADEAYNLIAQGAQKGLNQNDDLLDTINEYSVQFEMLGYSAEDMFNMLVNGANEGTWSVDKLGDAVKEFNIRAKDGSSTTADAFALLGLTVSDNSEAMDKARKKVETYQTQIEKLEKNIKYAQMQQSEFTDKTSELTKLKTSDNIEKWSKELQKLKGELSATSSSLSQMEKESSKGGQSAQELFNRFAEGGESARSATEEVLTALFAMDDKAQQNAVGVALFGTMWEDLGADAVKALLDTQGELSSTSDALDRINELKYDDIGSALQGLKRELETDVIVPLGEELQPVVEEAIGYVRENAPEIKALLSSIVTTVGNLIGFIVDNGQLLLTIITGIGVAFATWKVASMISGLIGVITSLIGVVKTGTTVMSALNTVIGMNPIALIITAIMALVAGFIYLWNNCEGFREFWIDLWEKIKTAFQGFIDWISPALDLIGEYYKNLGKTIMSVFSVIKDVLVLYFKNAWEGIKLVWSVAVDFFKTIWENIKLIFSVVVTYFTGMFSTAWESIKAIWNAVTGYFKAIWETIKGIFSVVKNVLTGNWSDAWEGIKKIVGVWTSYFSGVWESIKKVFSTTKTWFTSTFSSAWEAVKGVFSNWTSFFSGLWDKITNTFSRIGTNISNAISGSLKSGLNGVINALEDTINSGINLINGAIGLINKIPGVSIGSLGGVSLPRLARGGIVNQPTLAQIGEDGSEAIIPLEKNTEWLDEIANRLNRSTNSIGDNSALLSKLDGIYERLNRLQIVLDTGTLVGETIDKIDAGLATRQLLSARGV